jgi:hypothetical protein
VEPNKQYPLDIGVHIPAYATNGMVHHIEPYLRGQLSNFTAEFQLTTVVSTATQVKRVAHLGLSPQDVFIQGNYAYIAAGREGLRVWDITKPTAPTEVGFYAPQDDLFWSANKVVVKEHYAYVTAGQSGLRILDISNPAQPLEIGSYNAPGTAEDIHLVGSYAYVTWPVCHYPPCSGKLQIVDISDPTKPFGVSIYDKLQIRDLDIVGHYAYIATAHFTGAGGMHILDISEPTSPAEVGVYDLGSSGANGIIVHDNYAYLLLGSSGIIIDISNPENLTEVGRWNDSEYATGISLVDHYLYLPGFNTSTIFDVSDPTHPTEIAGNFEVLNSAKSIKVVNNQAYLAAGTVGLKIIDISNSMRPKVLRVLGLPGFAQAVAITNNYAYVADVHNGLRIFDVSKPLTPTEIGFYDKLGGASDVVIKDNYAYVNFGLCERNFSYRGETYQCDTDLHVLDISQPATPVEIEGYKEWREFKIAGNYAYVLDEAKWLHIFDIANPAAPKEINTLKEPVADFTLANGYLYLLPPVSNFQFAPGQSSFTQDSYLKIFDPISLAEISSLHLPNEYPAQSIIVTNDYAYIHWAVGYVNSSADGWISIDVSNPTTPILREDVSKPQYLQATAVAGHYAYFAAGMYGLRIYDMADPQNPIEVDAYGADHEVTGVAVANDYIYLASGAGGLSILHYPGN